jgi:hypothetical protein
MPLWYFDNRAMDSVVCYRRNPAACYQVDQAPEHMKILHKWPGFGEIRLIRGWQLAAVSGAGRLV